MISLIKNIFLDVFKLYRNFFHWSLSKIIIFIWTVVLAILSILPFVLIIFVYGYFAGLDLNALTSQVLTKTIGPDLFVNIFLYIITIMFFVMYMYQYVLLIKLNLVYKAENKLNYFKNYYFNFLKIKKHIVLSLLNILILLIPIFFFILFIGIFVVVTGSFENAKELLAGENNFFTWLTLIGFIISVIFFVYFFYRICFSYFLFIEDEQNDKKCFDYLVQSTKLTSGIKSFFKFLLVIIIFLTIMFPSKFLLNLSEQKVSDVSNFVTYKNLTDEDKELVIKSRSTYIQLLQLEYSSFSEEELSNILRKYDMYIILLNIFNFLFLYGIMSMVFVSFYKRELIKK